METAGIIVISVIGAWLVGSILSCWLWIMLWRRSMDVNFIALMMISTLSLVTSWVGATVALAYLAAGKVIVKKKNGTSL